MRAGSLAAIGTGSSLPPHPRPLSREGRGEKDLQTLRASSSYKLLLPSPLAGEGPGVEGAGRLSFFESPSPSL